MVSREVHVQPPGLNTRMPSSFERVLGYAVSVACVGAGVGLWTGLLRPVPPGKATTVAGLVLVLLGLNRFLLTRWKSQRARRRALRSSEVDDDAR